MSSYVLTLIGNARSAPLSCDHIARVWQSLMGADEKGEIAHQREDWLAQNEACDLFFSSTSTPSDLTRLAQNALAEEAIDAVCIPVAGRQKKLLISDMDSTIIDQECIDELGEAFGCGAQIKEITAAVVDGNISFSDALRQRMSLMEGMDFSLLEKTYEERLTLKKGAGTLVHTMRKNGAYCILVSGGFSFFTSRIAKRLGFDDHQANALVVKRGKLSGEVREPILDRSAKLTTLNMLCQKQKIVPFDVLAVGDGANDIDMISAAGLGVAFNGSASLRANANASINHNDLSALLYIQGFRKSQFVIYCDPDYGFESTK